MRRILKQHDVSTTHEMNWGELDNGELLTAAESEFDVLVTTDKNLRYQQKLAARHLAVLILPTASWPQLQAQQGQIVAVINALRSGEVVEMKM